MFYQVQCNKTNWICCKLWRSFYPQGWLRLAWNFGKTPFRWSPTFHFSTPKKFCSTKKLLPPPTLKTGKLPVLEELWIFGRHQQMRLENSLPELSVSAFYDPGVTFGQKKLAPSSDDIRRYSTIFDDTYKNEALRNIEETLRNIKVSINPLRNIKEPPTWNRPPTGH